MLGEESVRSGNGRREQTEYRSYRERGKVEEIDLAKPGECRR